MTDKKFSALILEDHVEIVDLLTDILNQYKFSIKAAFRVSEAMNLLQSNRFDLMICDLHMPGASGLELLQDGERKQLLPEQVVILTGDMRNLSHHPEYMKKFTCLEKPFFISELHSLLEKMTLRESS